MISVIVFAFTAIAIFVSNVTFTEYEGPLTCSLLLSLGALLLCALRVKAKTHIWLYSGIALLNILNLAYVGSRLIGGLMHRA